MNSELEATGKEVVALLGDDQVVKKKDDKIKALKKDLAESHSQEKKLIREVAALNKEITGLYKKLKKEEARNLKLRKGGKDTKELDILKEELEVKDAEIKRLNQALASNQEISQSDEVV